MDLEARLVVYNIQKKNNVRTMFTTAFCYDLPVCIVRQPTFSEETHMHEALRDRQPYERFASLDDCVASLRADGFEIWGVEISQEAIDVEHATFPAKVAFMPGNEGHGLTEKQKGLCDKFLIVKQFGNGTASLNVAVATHIICQRYASWRDAQEDTSAALDAKDSPNEGGDLQEPSKEEVAPAKATD